MRTPFQKARSYAACTLAAMVLAVSGLSVASPAELPSRALAVRPPAAITVDGVLDERTDCYPIFLDAAEQLDINGGWTGPEDLSAVAALAYDEQALYFAIRVADDLVVCADDMSRDFKDSDNVRLYLCPGEAIFDPRELPRGWHYFKGQVACDHGTRDKGHADANALSLSSDEEGYHGGWARHVTLEPNTDYKLSAWVKTEIENGRVQYARCDVYDESQEKDTIKNYHGYVAGVTRQSTDWTYVERLFRTPDTVKSATVYPILTWGKAKAWVSDVRLVKHRVHLFAFTPRGPEDDKPLIKMCDWDGDDRYVKLDNLAAAGVRIASKLGPDGYTIEFRIPLACLGLPALDGAEMGFQVMVADADNASGRESSLSWTTEKFARGLYYKSPATFGVLAFIPRPSAAEVKRHCTRAIELAPGRESYGVDDTMVSLDFRAFLPYSRDARWQVIIRDAGGATRIERTGTVTEEPLGSGVNVAAEAPLPELPDGPYRAECHIISEALGDVSIAREFTVDRETSKHIKAQIARLESQITARPAGRQIARSCLLGAQRAYRAGQFSAAKALLSAAAANADADLRLCTRTGFSIPEPWRPQQILDRTFWLEMPFGSYQREVFKRAGIADEPFVKEAALRVSWRIMQKPDSEEYKELLALPNPVILRSGYFSYDEAMRDLAEEAYRRFERDFGERFIGTHGIHEKMGALAGWGKRDIDEVIGKIADALGIEISRPTNRKEAHDAMRLQYQAITQKPYYKVYATEASFVDHFLYSLGLAISSPEIGGWEMCTPMQLAFARGAGRQYSKPWGAYLAAWGKGLVGDSHCIFNHLWPGGRTTADTLGYMDAGPHSGTSYSLQRRQLYASYMSGANLFAHESDQSGGSNYVANYDFRAIASVDPLVRVLRDRPYHISPIGAIWKEFYDNIVLKHDRGVPYTPIGLLFDRHHGCVLEYSRDTIYCAGVPYQRGDYMMRGVVNTLFPWETTRPGQTFEARTNVTGPFGDIFDVLTNDASPEALRSYPVLMLVGRVDIDEQFAGQLKDYIAVGGTLIANVKQLNERLPAAAFGCKLTGKTLQSRRALSLLDGALIKENAPFGFDELLLVGAMPLAIAPDVPDQPALIALAQYGKGRAILTAPHWMMPPEAKRDMLGLFSNLVAALSRELSPVRVTGNVQHIINRNQSGWVVTLINNEGVYKHPGRAAVIKPDESVDATVTLLSAAGKQVTQVNEWVTGAQLTPTSAADGALVKLTVPPGDIRIVEFALSRL